MYLYLSINDHQVLLDTSLSESSLQFQILHVTEWNSREDVLDQAVEPLTVSKGQLGESVET